MCRMTNGTVGSLRSTTFLGTFGGNRSMSSSVFILISVLISVSGCVESDEEGDVTTTVPISRPVWLGDASSLTPCLVNIFCDLIRLADGSFFGNGDFLFRLRGGVFFSFLFSRKRYFAKPFVEYS